MNKGLSIVVLLLLACLITGSYAAETDDARLSKKITYYSGYVRLSDAVAEISKLSGIRIGTGISNKDWQVRDMPVVVCANDIEVGKLLNLMTDAYLLTLKKTNVDGEVLYRLFRSQAHQEVISKSENNFENYRLQYEQNKWNTYDWLASLSDDDTEKLYSLITAYNPSCTEICGPGSSRLGFDEMVSYSKLFKAIGEEGKTRLLNGEEVILSAEQGGEVGKMVQDFALKSKEILDQMRVWLNRNNGDRFSASSKDLDDKEKLSLEQNLDRAQISFKLDRGGRLQLNSKVTAGNFIVPGCYYDFISFTQALTLPYLKNPDQKPPILSNMPSLPKVPQQPVLEMEYLKNAPNDKLLPDVKFELKKPDKEPILIADVLTEVSKKSGYSILADDFWDHYATGPNAYKEVFIGKKSIPDIKDSPGIKYGYKWYISKEDKLINLKDWSWANNYGNLIPKATFNGWLKKSETTGLGLYDFLVIWGLTTEQKLVWIHPVRSLSRIETATSSLGDSQRSLLGLLASISTDDLDTAAGSGINLAKITNLNIDLLARFLYTLPEDSRPKEELSRLYLRLIENTKMEANLEKRSYTVEILGSEKPLQFPLNVSFPIYTPDREQELKKAAAENK